MTKSALHARFKTDTKLEEQGVWVDFGEGLRVRVRRFKSRVVQDASKKFNKTEVGVIRKGGMGEEAATDILVRIIAEAVIVEWQGVTDENGNELEATFDNKYATLKELPEFRDALFEQSVSMDNFKGELLKESEGNY